MNDSTNGPEGEIAEIEVQEGQLVERASVRRNLTQMASSQVVTWVLATLASVIIPRYLGPETLGRLQLAGSLWAIAGVFTALGTSMYLQLSIARDQREGLQMMAPVFIARTGAFAMASVVLGIYVYASGEDSMFIRLMVILGLTTLLAMWSDVFGAGFMGLERRSTIAFLTAGARFLVLVANFVVLVLGYGVFALVGVNMAITALGVVVFRWRFRKVARIDWAGWAGRIRPVVVASAPFMVVTLALTTYRQIDVIVISRIAGSRDVGWYAAADLLAGSLLFPTTVIMSTVFPTFGRLHTHDPGRLRELVSQTFSLLLLAAVPIGLGAAIVGPTFAPLLFGDDFDGSGTALVIFGPITIFSFATTLLAYVALATERRRFLAILLIVSAALTIPLDALLVPWASDRYDNGAIGGALAYVVTETLQFIVGLIVIAPYLISRERAWLSVRVLAAGGVMVAAAWPFKDQLFVVPAVIGAIVYPLAILLFRALDDYQRSMIGDVLSRVGIRTRRSS
jgi:O-antigen/teichoic acid export membrane protein